MKSKIYILIIFLLSLFLVGCTKIVEVNDAQTFINYCGDVSKGSLKDACIIDLRPLQNDEDGDDYDHGHIHGSLSFDYQMQDEDKFINWITGLKPLKTTILLVDSGNKEYQVMQKYLKKAGYKKVISFTLGYQQLKSNPQFFQKVEESTGIEDCGC